MNDLKKFIETKYGLHLRKETNENYYPGSCDQCNMKKGGCKSIIYGFIPNLFLLICDLCYQDQKKNIDSMISNLQDSTFFHKIPKDKKFSILNNNFQIENDWLYHPKYLFNIFNHNNQIFIPLINHSNNINYVSLRHWLIMNDYLI